MVVFEQSGVVGVWDIELHTVVVGPGLSQLLLFCRVSRVSGEIDCELMQQ